MSRKTDFPKVMCTQHPDSASKYIATQEEPGEAIEAALVFGCDEYMPDYEGKATPYHQNVQIVSKLVEETDLIPGKDFFITPRAPSAVQENRFRQLMVMMSIAEANYNALEYSDVQAINEFVHPMTGSVREIIEAQQHMVDVSELAKKEFGFSMEVPRIIPLVEDAPALLHAKELVRKHYPCLERTFRDSAGQIQSVSGQIRLCPFLRARCKHAFVQICNKRTFRAKFRTRYSNWHYIRSRNPAFQRSPRPEECGKLFQGISGSRDHYSPVRTQVQP